MRITSEWFEMSDAESVRWEDVKRMRLLNEKLAVVLKHGKTVELSGLHPSQIDLAFKTFEKYLKDHPARPKRKKRLA